MMGLTPLVGLTWNKRVEEKDCSATDQRKFLFYREVIRWKRRCEVNIAVLKMHVVGFEARDLNCTSKSCPCCGAVKVQQMTSVNTNCSFRHLQEWSLQLLILKELQIFLGGTNYSSDKQSFPWFAHLMSSGGIYERRFCEQPDFSFYTLKMFMKFS